MVQIEQVVDNMVDVIFSEEFRHRAIKKEGERKAIVSLVQDGSISITKGAEKLAISVQEIERLMESSVKVRR